MLMERLKNKKQTTGVLMNSWTRITYCAFVALLGQSFFLQQVQAQEDDAAALVAIIHAVAEGWEQADGTPFREHFLDFEERLAPLPLGGKFPALYQRLLDQQLDGTGPRFAVYGALPDRPRCDARKL